MEILGAIAICLGLSGFIWTDPRMVLRLAAAASFVWIVFAAGMGIAYAPRFAIADMMETGRLLSLLDDFEMDGGPIAAVYLEGRTLPRKIRAIIDFAVKDMQSTDMP